MASTFTSKSIYSTEISIDSISGPQQGLPKQYDDDFLIGDSPEIAEIRKMIDRVAPENDSILITGESGTGKQLLARLIYKKSSRSEKPFIAVNCGGIPESILDLELFGIEGRAVTSTGSPELGKFQQCAGGTIFLNNIADISLSIQGRILRMMQEREFEGEGEYRAVRADIRIIAATDKSLVSAIKESRFRVDLFYLLKSKSIFLPPLRDRQTDIPPLVEHFLKRYGWESARRFEGVGKDIMERLMAYPWPGNVRELENNVQTAALMCSGKALRSEHFPALTGGGEGSAINVDEFENEYFRNFSDTLTPAFHKIASISGGNIYQHLMGAMEKALYSAALKYCGSNQVKASGLLGISRNTLRDRVKKYRLY